MVPTYLRATFQTGSAAYVVSSLPAMKQVSRVNIHSVDAVGASVLEQFFNLTLDRLQPLVHPYQIYRRREEPEQRGDDDQQDYEDGDQRHCRPAFKSFRKIAHLL